MEREDGRFFLKGELEVSVESVAQGYRTEVEGEPCERRDYDILVLSLVGAVDQQKKTKKKNPNWLLHGANAYQIKKIIENKPEGWTTYYIDFYRVSWK